MASVHPETCISYSCRATVWYVHFSPRVRITHINDDLSNVARSNPWSWCLTARTAEDSAWRIHVCGGKLVAHTKSYPVLHKPLLKRRQEHRTDATFEAQLHAFSASKYHLQRHVRVPPTYKHIIWILEQMEAKATRERTVSSRQKSLRTSLSMEHPQVFNFQHLITLPSEREKNMNWASFVFLVFAEARDACSSYLYQKLQLGNGGWISECGLSWGHRCHVELNWSQSWIETIPRAAEQWLYSSSTLLQHCGPLVAVTKNQD